jgi:competence protein ComEC
VRRDTGPLFVLGALVFGILIGQGIGGAPATLTVGCGALALVGSWMVDGRARVVIAAVALALLGSAVMQRALHGLEHHALLPAVAAGDVVELHGVLVSDPDARRFGADARLRVDGTDRIVLVRASGDDTSRLRVLDAGDRVTVRGRLEELSGYDVRAHWDHAIATMTGSEVVRFEPPNSPLMKVANAVRAVILRGTRPLDPTPRALLAGFLLGDTRAIPNHVTDEYRAAGLSHLLAVSGANVAFVLLVCAPLLRRLALGGRTAAAMTIVLCFAAATRFEPSVLRASALATVTILATFFGRTVSPLRALIVAVSALLLVDPFLVHSLGFHLSCAASAGIALWARPLASRLPGPALIREPFAVSISAQLGVTPVLLVTFGNVPLLTPLANLLAAPAAEALGVFGLAASAFGGIVPPIGAVLAPVTTALIAWVSGIARVTSEVGGTIDTRTAIVGAVAIAGVVVVVRVLHRRSPSAESTR